MFVFQRGLPEKNALRIGAMIMVTFHRLYPNDKINVGYAFVHFLLASSSKLNDGVILKYFSDSPIQKSYIFNVRIDVTYLHPLH